MEKGLSYDEAHALALPISISPLKQELISWHHRLYHMPFKEILLLAPDGRLPKKLLECRNSPPLFVVFQFGQAHRRPGRVTEKKRGSIRNPEHIDPGDGVSVDHIISSQPGFITQMSVFLTNKRIWG